MHSKPSGSPTSDKEHKWYMQWSKCACMQLNDIIDVNNNNKAEFNTFQATAIFGSTTQHLNVCEEWKSIAIEWVKGSR